MASFDTDNEFLLDVRILFLGFFCWYLSVRIVAFVEILFAMIFVEIAVVSLYLLLARVSQTLIVRIACSWLIKGTTILYPSVSD